MIIIFIKMKERKKILFFDPDPKNIAYKILFFLKEYAEIYLVSLIKDFPIGDFEKMGCKVFVVDVLGRKDKSRISKIGKTLFDFYKLREINPDIIISRGEPNWPSFIVGFLFLKKTKVFFPYDITFFRYSAKSKTPLFERISEFACYRIYDLIMHKGPENEMSWVNPKLQRKQIQFLTSCFDPWIINKSTKKTEDISLVYVGVSASFDSSFSMSGLFSDIANSGVDFHLYPSGKNESLKDIKSKYFHLHNRVPNKELSKKLSQYHFGTRLCFESGKDLNPLWQRSAMSNKIFSYLEAGLPIIVDDKNEFVKNFVEKNNIGFVVCEKDIPNLRKIIFDKNYSELLKNVKKAQKNLSISSQVNNLWDRINSILPKQ